MTDKSHTVFVTSTASDAALKELVKIPNLSFVYTEPDCTENSLFLLLADDCLSLTNKVLTLCADFTHMLPRIKKNNLNGELIVKAAKIKSDKGCPLAADATAGLAEDSFLLAAAGFEVQLFEYNPVIAALLSNALLRASHNRELCKITELMHLNVKNSITELPKITPAPDLILLDPMFPARQKSGLVKKKFQLLQMLEQPCTDENELLSAAIKAKPKKIIIKRPSKGPYLGNVKPGYSVTGDGIRYDCIVMPQAND